MTTITRHIARADRSASPYFYIPFAVPAGTTRIDVGLAYAKAEDCIIDLGVFDPRDTGYPSTHGFRGWSGGARDRFFIATDDATPGYIHGEIQPGTWTIILGLYKIPETGADVSVTIALDATARALTPQPARSFPVRRQSGWYRGDLHCHTFHSDARGGPDRLHAAAQQAGLDFLAVSDHNTITQRRYFHPKSTPDLVFVRAMEITTAEGHANVYGVDEWIDFRMSRPADAHRLAQMVHAKGGLLSINHDKPPIAWEYEWPDADCQEVWQSAWFAWNWIALERWQARLAAGLKLSAIGGSDFHQPAELQPEGPLVLGRPTTVLFLTELSEDAILAGMKAGHGYITESPSGPHLEILAGDAVMGSAASPLDSLTAIARAAAGDVLSLIDASGEIARIDIDSNDWRSELSVTPKGFVRAEIVAGPQSRKRLLDEGARLLAGRELPWQLRNVDLGGQAIRRAVSNPIYIKARRC